MKILLAPDSFKGSLDAPAVCRVMAQAIRELHPGAEVISMPMSDGGEGFTEVLLHNRGGLMHWHEVRDPLGRNIQAGYGELDSGEAAVEVAMASGLTLLKADELDPMRASSLGTGQLLARAIEAGYRQLLVGLGGSATNDAGAGMLTGLGFRLLDDQGAPIGPGAKGLLQLHRIDTGHCLSGLEEARITVASDVHNPLLGERGASRVYGPQKGARDDQLEILEAALQRFAEVAEKTRGREVSERPGAGAAGGIGAALMAFTNTEFRSGFEVVAELAGLEEQLAEKPDLVITGEGRLDAQSMEGKLPQGVAQRAHEHRTPVVAIAGLVQLTPEQVEVMGLDAAYALGKENEGIDVLLRTAEQRLRGTTQKAIKAFVTA